MSAPSPDIVISARALTKRFGERTAVAGIDFEVRRGECFGFLGPNGAGKTTTMRMIYRASGVTSGELTVCGFDAVSAAFDREIKKRVGVVPQEDNLDSELTARAQMIAMARFHGLTGAAGRARVEELLDFVKLADRADATLHTFSGGMKRRTLIARGLIGSPEILVLDEPTTGLDPQARQDLWTRLTALKRKGATLLLTTHYMDEAERLCDRLVIIDDGKIVAMGTPRELIVRHVMPHVVELSLAGDSVVPEPVKPLVDAIGIPAAGEPRSLRERVEVLPERLLFYVKKGDELLAELARRMPDARTLLRPSTLEDVFLSITGRSLEE